jgi:hypothetical protein
MDTLPLPSIQKGTLGAAEAAAGEPRRESDGSGFAALLGSLVASDAPAPGSELQLNPQAQGDPTEGDEPPEEGLVALMMTPSVELSTARLPIERGAAAASAATSGTPPTLATEQQRNTLELARYVEAALQSGSGAKPSSLSLAESGPTPSSAPSPSVPAASPATVDDGNATQPVGATETAASAETDTPAHDSAEAGRDDPDASTSERRRGEPTVPKLGEPKLELSSIDRPFEAARPATNRAPGPSPQLSSATQQLLAEAREQAIHRAQEGRLPMTLNLEEAQVPLKLRFTPQANGQHEVAFIVASQRSHQELRKLLPEIQIALAELPIDLSDVQVVVEEPAHPQPEKRR